jgi:two-component system phosphate regulon response regulator PhoB
MYTIGPLRVDVEGYYVFVEEDEIHLSATEMRLLVHLITHPDKVRSPAELMESVWGYKRGTMTRTIQTIIKRLRDKLGEAGALIENVRGAGYRLVTRQPLPRDG